MKKRTKILIGILAVIVLAGSWWVWNNPIKNPQIKCSGTCKCMEKCNEKGPTYFIPVGEEFSECSINSVNKICCCSGV